jgi:hydrophobic/amphiphilic exporter-1 (mainly G- bacteria), HAE1 family
VSIDRHKAADLGVRVDTVAAALRTMVGGEKVGFYRELGEQYDVRLRLREDFRARPDTLNHLYVPARDGLVKISNLATLASGTSPGQIERFAQERSVTVISNLVDKPLADAFREALGVVRQQKMPPEYGIVTSGRGKLLQEAIFNFLIALVLSLAFIYIVLAAQFESFIHPVTILLTLPIAVPFGLLASLLFGQTLNIYSALGVLLLFGIVKKNAILQIDHTLGLRAKGMERHEAIIQANRDRLRPILMTTLALVAGMLPLCLGSGPGAATNRSIGILVAGGQSLCLLLTLLAVPVFYSLFDDAIESPAWGRMGRRWERRTGGVRRAVRRVTGRRQAARQGADR